MKKKTVLIVEDCPILGWDLKWYLSEIEWTVILATSADKTLQLCEQHIPDLILLHCRCRKGQEDILLAKQIRRGLGLPIIFLTTHPFHFFDTQPDFYPGHDILYKPFNRWQLRKMMKEAERYAG